MTKYELVTILDAQLTSEKKESIHEQVVDSVVKGGGKVINKELWLDKHKMTFKIKRCIEATYYLIRFEALTSAVAKIKQTLKVNEDILRFAIYRTQE